MADPHFPQTVIIGAGPAGLTAAYYLSQKGRPVLVLEESPDRVGGLSQTVVWHGNRFDIGGHRFFTKSQEIEALWNEILGPDEFRQVPRLSRIYYRKKFYAYPLRSWQALRNLGPLVSLHIIFSYARARLFPLRPERSFADWVSNRFGRTLFSLFFKSYTEKVWGMKTEDISADWAAQRIQGLSFARAAMDGLIPARFKKSGIKTLIQEFRYPRLGPGQMWEAAAEKVRRQGGELRMGASVNRIERKAGRVAAVVTGQGERIDVSGELISSMPIRSLIGCLAPPAPAAVRTAADGLRYRDFLTVALVVDRPELFPDNWIYIHDPAVQVGRIQNYKNWSADLVKDPAATSVIGLEYFCTQDDDLWKMPDSELQKLAEKEIRLLELLGPKDRVIDATVVRMPKAYPVYDESYKKNVETIRRWLEENAVNLVLVGRNGMHKYNNQDHSMLTALLAAKNILGEGEYDLWKVHTDATYDEGGGSEAGDQKGRSVPMPLRTSE